MKFGIANSVINNSAMNLDGARLNMWRESDATSQDYYAQTSLDDDFAEYWTLDDMSPAEKRKVKAMVKAWNRCDYKRFGQWPMSLE